VCSWSVRTWRLIVTGMNCLVSLLVIDSDRICSGVSLASGMNIIPSKAQSEKNASFTLMDQMSISLWEVSIRFSDSEQLSSLLRLRR
jgi:hypothetical protein